MVAIIWPSRTFIQENTTISIKTCQDNISTSPFKAITDCFSCNCSKALIWSLIMQAFSNSKASLASLSFFNKSFVIFLDLPCKKFITISIYFRTSIIIPVNSVLFV